MNTRLLAVGLFLLLALLVSSCTKTTPTGGGATPKASSISGYVVRSDNFQRVPSVIVADPSGTASPDTTDNKGFFSLHYQITDTYSGRLIASRTTFNNDTVSFTLAAGANDTLTQNLVIKADSNSQKTDTTSATVASIVLIGGDAATIALRGTGFTESTTLTFEARDSLGVTVGSINKARVYFSLLGGPGGGEYVYPTSALTDLAGRVVTRVTSGSKPGVLQVYAYAKPDSLNPNLIVTSSPVRVTISGGLPDQAHFSMNVQKANVAGIIQDNLRDAISVIVGDKFGNPVQQGTAIYFSTTAGIIQPSASTDKDGFATVSLITSNPRPSGSGLVFVTARTVGDSGAIVAHMDTVLFSGAPRITLVSNTPHIADSASADYYYMVSDSNGNPLSAGTTITVAGTGPGSGGLVGSGDVAVVLPDTKDRRFTNFKFTATDQVRGGPSGDVKFTIAVTGDNGTASYSWDVTQDPGGFTPGAGSTGLAASIQLLGTSTNSISVRGTGQQETAIISYIVKDSVGNPVTTSNAVNVTFTIQNGPGGGEYVFPAATLTDGFGRASTAVNSGTKSGVVQVVASTLVNGTLNLKSSPVQLTIAGGLADINHSRMWSDAVNYPILVNPGKTLGTISIQLGDIYNNPAQSSAVYFTTNGGLISATALTGTNGLASASLQGGGQYPAGGIDTITAVTQGNQNITQKLIVTASGAPIITAPSLSTTTISPLSGGGVQNVSIDVKDLNGNPLSAGNVISVSMIGDPTVTGQIALSLNNAGTSIITGDTRDTASVHYNLKLTASSSGTAFGGSFAVLVKAAGPNGNGELQLSASVLPRGVTIPPSAGAKLPAQIVPGAPSSTDLSVVGVGGVESSQLSFQVLDSTRAPLDKFNRTYASFSIDFYPNTIVTGGTSPHLLPVADSTDDNGVVRMSIVSGSEAGVAQVVARIQLGGGQTIISQPVRIVIHSGFADRGHFTLMQNHFVVPTGASPTFTVAIGDTFGNPVSPGTAVYFYSQAGIMTSGAAFTNGDGFATNTLITGVNPTPDAAGTLLAGRPTYDATHGPGYQWVYGQTKGNYGTQVIDSTLIVWAEAPIKVTGLPATLAIPSGGTSANVPVTITDGRGNPLPDGTTITISFTYPTNITGLSYTASGSISSFQATTIPNSAFALFPGPGVTTFSFSVTDGSLPATPAGTRIQITLLVTAPGLDAHPFSFVGVF